MTGLTVGVLMTCHNRRDQTLASLDSLFAQDAPVELQVFLVDDGSSDGTSASVLARHKNVLVIRGDGSLFWAAAMARAEHEAHAAHVQLLWWLNDDVVLDPTCLSRLLLVHEAHPGAIVVGAMRDPITGAPAYGGRRRIGAHPQRLSLLPISNDVQECDTFHGNCVLVPRSASDTIGPIDSTFPHGYADDDYGLRARQVGIRILQSPGSVGSCSPNPALAPVRGLRARWRYLQSPKGLPLRAQYRFLRRHGGIMWPIWLVGGTTKRLLRP